MRDYYYHCCCCCCYNLSMWNERPRNKQKSFYYWKILLIHDIVEDIKNRIENTDKANLVIHKNSVYIKHLFNSDCNWTRTQNHLVLKRTLNHLAKWLSVRLRTKWFWVRVQLQSLHLQISRLLRARSSLTFRQL